MPSHKITIELTAEQLVDVVAALHDASSYRANIAHMWKYDVDPTLPADRAIADLFNRAYYEN